MSWKDVDPYIRDIAETHCTTPQLEALKLSEDGLGYRRIGNQLGISASSARDRIRRALSAIEHATEAAA